MEALLTLGIVCIVAAVVGGGLEMLGIKIPPIESQRRQLGLGVLGLLLIIASRLPTLSSTSATSTPVVAQQGQTTLVATSTAIAPSATQRPLSLAVTPSDERPSPTAPPVSTPALRPSAIPEPTSTTAVAANPTSPSVPTAPTAVLASSGSLTPSLLYQAPWPQSSGGWSMSSQEWQFNQGVMQTQGQQTGLHVALPPPTAFLPPAVIDYAVEADIEVVQVATNPTCCRGFGIIVRDQLAPPPSLPANLLVGPNQLAGPGFQMSTVVGIFLGRNPTMPLPKTSFPYAPIVAGGSRLYRVEDCMGNLSLNVAVQRHIDSIPLNNYISGRAIGLWSYGEIQIRVSGFRVSALSACGTAAPP